ncbi:alpha/beta hydrolase [Trinickia violacea]|uniref:Alpha/beta hydrolase n=1 Tax=Trinickia violacea TaxID=2571746 RepID=A0A4P8IRM3_9BURK|nr:alpha/beta hydrolase [Trinickia violacea]QCP50365.1 alpha/beta hydrolase [Trinickia violacea]
MRRFNVASGLSVAADVGGDPAGSAVVLLHGGGQTRHSWKSAFDALVAAGHHVVALDARGHGESDWDPAGDYSIDALVSDLRSVLMHTPPLPILVGASMGGMTALAAVGETAQPIARALVLVDVTPMIDVEGSAHITAFMRANSDGFASVEDAAVAVAGYLPHRPRPRDVSGLERNLRQRDGRFFWHWDPRLVSDSRFDRLAVQSRLEAATRRLRVPTLLIRGAQSNIVGDEQVAHFRTLAPEAEYVNVDGAGHMVAGDRNDAFNHGILDFIARVDQGGVSPPHDRAHANSST